MIYTITFNPAIDLVMATDQVKLGSLNRVHAQDYVAGGKGINISVILKELGVDSTATGFIGGFTGEFIEKELEKHNIQSKFIHVEGNTRINVKIKAEEETELNGSGPFIAEKEFDRFYQFLKNKLSAEDTVFLSGNTAKGLNSDAYVAIAKLCQDKETRFIVDSNKDLLTKTLKYEPFLIKPNQTELEEIFNIPITNKLDIINYAKELKNMGARNVLVSCGGDGAVLLTEDGDFYSSNVAEGEVINSVGSGDSMIAGFMAKYIQTTDFPESLKLGAAAGSATAFSVGTADRKQIESLTNHITIKNIIEGE